MRRPLLRRLLHKSVLSAQELEVYGDFQFGGASFDLLFGRGVDIRAKSETPVIKVKKGKDVEVLRQENRGGVELNGGDAILVGASAPAVYLEEEHLDDEKGI